MDLDVKDSVVYDCQFVTALVHAFGSSLERMAMLERKLFISDVQSSLCKRNVIVDHSLWFGALSMPKSQL